MPPTTMPGRAPRRATAGFTLMEVNVALLLMAIGLLGLFSLFSIGLRQSGMATSDTAQTAFADQIFNAMRANASLVTNWTDWVSLTNGVALGVSTSSDPTRQINLPAGSGNVQITVGGGFLASTAERQNHQLAGYLNGSRFIEYELHIEADPQDLGNGTLYRAWMRVVDRQHADLENAPVYVTAFVFMGM